MLFFLVRIYPRKATKPSILVPGQLQVIHVGTHLCGRKVMLHMSLADLASSNPFTLVLWMISEFR